MVNFSLDTSTGNSPPRGPPLRPPPPATPQVFVLADTAYNPLGVDEVAAAHLAADCVVGVCACVVGREGGGGRVLGGGLGGGEGMGQRGW